VSDDIVAEVAERVGSVREARWILDDVLADAPAGAVVVVPDVAPRRAVTDVTELTPRQRVRLEELVARREAGEALQYVLGHWGFRSLDLVVDPRVLIPRPETEQVVEVALAVLAEVARDKPDPVIVDLGTGSGAIALSVAMEALPAHPRLRVIGTDVDAAALEVASRNRERLGMARAGVAERVTLRRGGWFDALPESLSGHVDLAIANPPYVADSEWEDLAPDVRSEPRGALMAAAGSDGTPGLAGVEAVLVGARRWLSVPGAAVVELSPEQAGPAHRLAEGLGYDRVTIVADLAGRDRVVVARTHR